MSAGTREDGRVTCRPFLLGLGLLLAGCATQAPVRRADASKTWKPAWSATGGAWNTGFGTRAMGLGDVNGDGYGDFAVGAPSFDNGRGKAVVYCGGPQGPGKEPCWSKAGDTPDGHFGDRVGQAGDLNGDGYADLFIAIPSWRQGPGKVEVYYGSKQGLGQEPGWSQAPTGAEKEQFGDCTHPTGDVNGDGYDDLLVGAYQALSSSGRALLYLGGKDGLAVKPVWEGKGETESDQYGYTLSTAGDVNGDGFGDVLIGAKFHDNSAELSRTAKSLALSGKAYLYFGASDGQLKLAWVGRGEEAQAQYSVRGYALGDSDGDGQAELMLSAPGVRDGAGLVVLLDAATRAVRRTISGEGLGLSDFGRAAGPAGDVDGDGFDDLIIGGRKGGDGAVYLFPGDKPGSARELIELDGASSRGGYGAWVAPAGDIDGDGLADVLVSSPIANEGFDLAGKVELFLGKDLPGAKKLTQKNGVPHLNVYLPFSVKKQ